MKKYNSSCPVPIDQQPMYEYETLKNSIFFFWTTETLKSYIRNIINLIILNYLIVSLLFFISGSISLEVPKIQNAIFISLIVDSVIILLFIRIYLGWEYIYQRLKKATISYEESGWYDGQVWIKSPDILIKDRLTADYILLPIIKRIKITLFCLVFYLFTLSILNKFL